jgi:hypothetical protein
MLFTPVFEWVNQFFVKSGPFFNANVPQSHRPPLSLTFSCTKGGKAYFFSKKHKMNSQAIVHKKEQAWARSFLVAKTAVTVSRIAALLRHHHPSM